MIYCKLVNNAAYSLVDREALSSSVHMAETIPHVLLKTCNRTELYWGEGSISEDVIRHIYRVAAGLESSLIGERAIQGQIKNAYTEAITRYKLSSSLNKLFQTAMCTGKRVRTETGIAEGAISHSQVTVDILKQRGIDLRTKIIGIIGINKLTEDILKFLSSRGAASVLLSNRSIKKAQDMAAKYNAAAMSLEHKASIIELSDVLICATSAPHAIVKAADIAAEKELLIFDLAFPRDVDDEVRKLKNVDLLNLEDIERFAKDNLSLRENEICKAEQIIEEEIGNLCHWLSYATKAAIK